MKAIDRLYLYLDYKGVKPTRFEHEVGFSSGYLSKMKARNSDMGESQMNIVLENCPDLDEIWFITGKGIMLKENPDSFQLQNDPEVTTEYNSPFVQELLTLHRELNEKSNKIIEQADTITMLKEELALLRKG
jgi:hypothetical protein